MKKKFSEKIMGDNVRRARRNRIPSMSLDELAEASGVTRVTINNIELGKIPNPGIITIVQISQALETPIGMIVGEEKMSDEDLRAMEAVRAVIAAKSPRRK